MGKFAIVFILFLLFFPQQFAFAQTASPTPPLTPHQQAIQKVNYSLPYPGLLPNNPLYILKAIRDRVISFLIADPKRKAEFDLLQADKRLSAGMYLLQAGQNQGGLAVETISKGENYFFMAISETKTAQKQGENITDIVSRLENASLKHQQVFDDLENQTQGQVKDRLQIEEKRVEDFENSAAALMPGK